ncbi:MAG: S-methyl-5'-thioinosine phosphorylase [Granulosicoccaceae bacterium]
MATIAIIGGTGLARMEGLEIKSREMIKTPYGAPSCPIIYGELNKLPVAFLARHGHTHKIPPHRINYCANIWALHSIGVKKVVAVGAVGGISEECKTGSIVVPDQIVNYTTGRTNTFYDGPPSEVRHVDFSYPYDDEIRNALIKSGSQADADVVNHGTYGATQGPHLETIAEVARMERDGCTIVGMTGMPEAVLARELDMAYACCGVVVNAAAGKGADIISMEEIKNGIDAGMQKALGVVEGAVKIL